MRRNAHFTGFVRSWEYDKSIIYLPWYYTTTFIKTTENKDFAVTNKQFCTRVVQAES